MPSITNQKKSLGPDGSSYLLNAGKWIWFMLDMVYTVCNCPRRLTRCRKPSSSSLAKLTIWKLLENSPSVKLSDWLRLVNIARMRAVR